MLARFLIALTLFQVIKASFTNKEELIEFIKSLNDDESDQSDGNDLSADSDGPGKLDDSVKEQKLREVLWLLKKNYDAKNQNKRHLEIQNTPRLFIISNPEVLDDYLKKNFYNYQALNKLRRNSLWDQDNSNRVGSGGASHLERPSKSEKKISKYSNEQGAELGDKEDRLSQIRKLKKTFKDYSIEHKETPKKYNFDKELNRNDENFKEYSLGHRKPPVMPKNQMLNKQKVFVKKPEYSSEQRVPNFNYANRPNKKRMNKIRKQDYEPPRNRYDDHRPRQKVKSRMSQGRTSIPFIGSKNVYEE